MKLQRWSPTRTGLMVKYDYGDYVEVSEIAALEAAPVVRVVDWPAVWEAWQSVVGQLPDPYDAQELERLVARHTKPDPDPRCPHGIALRDKNGVVTPDCGCRL